MASSRQFKLAKESELRVEVGPDMPLRIRLLSGTAEIFGTELPPSNWLSISPRSKIAVSHLFLFSSWHYKWEVNMEKIRTYALGVHLERRHHRVGWSQRSGVCGR